ncbi:MAG: hypothetical protein JST86_15795 [Bacteroidetes bacterium]|nr:hypothetical protein [Bacteroidota bacterium]
MKKLLLLLPLLLYHCCYAQDEKKIEQELLKPFNQIDYWLTHQELSDKINSYDSIENVNQAFLELLLKYTATEKRTINYSFKKLQKAGLTVATSADSLFRVYSWDTYTGGTMHVFYTVYQYKINGKIFSKTPGYMEEEGDAGAFCAEIFTIKNTSHTYYLAVSHAILSTKDAAQSVDAFEIGKDSLNDAAKIIKTKTGLHSSLSFEYDFFSVADHPERPVKLVFFDKTTKTLRIPVVTEEGKVTSKFIRYRFTGKYFEKQ